VGDGLHTLFLPHSGRHTLRVTAFGYKPLERTAAAHPDRVTRVDLRLAHQG
jgi:hypothetical protein